MTDTRRNFLKKASLLAGGTGLWSVLPVSIEKALAITPDKGTTFNDAEHVVMLMQENRSFDHCFGTLKGVRGFNDPLAISLPDKNPVWFQPDKSGNRFVPFRLDIKDTRATWMGGVPHSWEDQVDARNDGKYDGWIEAKRPGNKDFKHIPLAMGYYTREDIPFYYALADAFTVCDQHFCAALTGTTANRNYFWAGKTHGSPGEKARVRNGELNYEHEVDWTTFPDRLEDAGISWRVYQNEISLPTTVEDSSLLANFTDNNLEWFTQYGVRYAEGFQEFLRKREQELPLEIRELEQKLSAGDATEKQKKQLASLKRELQEAGEQLSRWNKDKFDRLSARAKSLHQRAFTTNAGDPDYHKVVDMSYKDGLEERVTKVPKGDILYQFRKDVDEGKLPTVSWLVAPQKFSDHPSAPWYGAWYISEVLDILTSNPEVWKKTIFILNYDENDGYFDHVPPFVAPDPRRDDGGRISSGLDATGEFVTIEEEVKAGFEERRSRTSPVGLGFRVPMVIASPWTRGGWVNSEVCDITSTIQFLEKFLSHKTGKEIREPNISSWRRTVSGDLTSAFRPYNGEKISLPDWLDRDKHIQQIYNARDKGTPDNFRPLSAKEVEGGPASLLPRQEPGTKPSNGLKYDLYVDGNLSADGSAFVIRFRASNDLFGDGALGAPFNVYAPGNYRNDASQPFTPVRTWAFAVKAGDELEYRWPLENFQDGVYLLRVYGPNGFFREFSGTQGSRYDFSVVPIRKGPKRTGKLQVSVKNRGKEKVTFQWRDDWYQNLKKEVVVSSNATDTLTVDTLSTRGWYRISLRSSADPHLKVVYAGRLETGFDSISDPYMGGAT